ncbi:MAG: class I SAM-dependent methyltransferase [Cyanobacteria bacterium P01_H01_bin.15]
MTTLTSQQNEHDAQASKAFFDRWHIYLQIIKSDYMAHQGIHARLRQSLMTSYTKPFTMLDLGCGDALFMASTLKDLPIRSYLGVDLSPVALDKACENLRDLSCEKPFIQADFVEYLEGSDPVPFDVIVAGFSMHHLHPAEKEVFFRACNSWLTDIGELFVYDIFRRDGESRGEYLVNYIENCNRNWGSLCTDALAILKDHIIKCDYPETYADFVRLANVAGLTAAPDPVYADDNRFHCLCRLQKHR